MAIKNFLNNFRGEVVVSTQGVGAEPTNDPYFLRILARAVIAGGAKILRVSQVPHIQEIQKETIPQKIDLVSLIKADYPDSKVFITPTKKEIDQLAKLNVACIALDGTLRNRPGGEKLSDIYHYARRKYPHIALFADCSDETDHLYCQKLGFDIIGSTLRGYTTTTSGLRANTNNYQFARKMRKLITKAIFVIEGGIWSPEEAKLALSLADTIVIGSAITRPHEITKKYMETVLNRKSSKQYKNVLTH